MLPGEFAELVLVDPQVVAVWQVELHLRLSLPES